MWWEASWHEREIPKEAGWKRSDMKITGRQGERKRSRTPPNPILRPIRHRDNHHPHLILGCPVVMFFNYVSLFNVAAAHPYLVNRCNFSCRVEMQPSHPGIKGQIELPQAQRERERFTFISIFFQATSAIWSTTGRFSACQATFKENVRYGNLPTVHEIFYFCLHCNPWKYVYYLKWTEGTNKRLKSAATIVCKV